MTEGEKAINIKLSLSLLPSRLRRATYCPLAVSRFCLCGLERRTKSTAAPTDAPFIRHRLRSHTLPVRGRLYFHIIVNLISPESSLFLLVCSDSRTGNQNQSEKNYKKVLTYKIKRDIVIPYLTDRKYIKTFRRYGNE